MDRAKIEEHIKLLRERRESLAEIRDYKVQKRAAKAAPEPKPDSVPAEEIFAGLFTVAEESNDTDGANGPATS